MISFEHPATELAGRISGDLDRTGQTIGKADPMIAAIALQHGLELVTGNSSHYQRIQQLGYPLTDQLAIAARVHRYFPSSLIDENR